MIKKKHQQLYNLLCEELQRGTWPSGRKLPNIKELSKLYDVSINVASKAIDMLKQDNLVSVKVGAGIYSKTSGRNEMTEFKYSGDRLFGTYRISKELHVLVEDNSEWQIAFWDVFFEKFSEENPDIELKVYYNIPDKKYEQKFDLVLGSLDFLAKVGFNPENTISASKMNEFYGNVYNGLLLEPADFSFLGGEHYLPFGFINYKLLTNRNISEPTDEENVLDYIERLAEDEKSGLGYGINNGIGLLANSGVQFTGSVEDDIKMPSQEKLLKVFKRARKLYQAGHLIWLHGTFSDYEQIYAMPEEQTIHIAEYPFNRNSKSEQNKLIERGMKLTRYPAGKHLVIVPEVAAISNKSFFPEECLRIVKELLSTNSQKQLRKHNIAQPLQPRLLEEDSYLVDEFKRSRSAGLIIFDQRLTEIFNYIIGWEFFYYLKGRRQDEVIEFIDKKVKYYFTARKKEKEEQSCLK
jgi:DNA-binding transcriptional regulator YhcF (GntR family)